MKIIVLKFGGTSVGTLDRIVKISKIIISYIKKKYNSKIIACKTIRDKNLLALSSRHLNIKRKELIKASKLTTDLIDFKKNFDL